MGGASYEHRMACEAIDHSLSANPAALGRHGIGEYLNRIGAIGKLKDFYSGHSHIVLFELIFVPVFLAMVIYIAGPLAIVPATILMVFTVTSLATGQKLRSELKQRDKADDKRYDFLIESLEGIHTIKAFALENRISRKYESLEEKSTLSNYNVTDITSSGFNIGNVFSHLMIASVVSIGAVFVLQGQMTTGALIATILLSGRMMQPVQRALSLWVKYQDYTLAKEKVSSVFETPLHMPVVNDNDVVREGRLALNNISFRFEDNTPWILDDVSLKLDNKETILLSGTHGSGKTSLLRLIAGIYPTVKGDIIVDGQNILAFASDRLVRHVGFVQSNGVVFRGTIRDNMTCFGQADEERAREIAALLDIDKDVARLPAGFDTYLEGSRNDKIPPGLRQRIAMVRSLAFKPRIILFDNADKALDRRGYNLVYNLLAKLKGKATMLIVSDDYNIRGLADQFMTIENGKLLPAEGSTSSGHIRPYRELQI